MFGRTLRSVRPMHVAGALAFGGVTLEVSNRSPAHAAAANTQVSDARGMTTTLKAPGGTDMNLMGVGMRRKNLWVTEVDVYLAGCYVNNDAMEAGLALSAEEKTSSLPAAFLSAGGQGPIVCIKSKFVRDVGKDKIVESFNEAFQGCDADAVARLKAHLGAVIGDSGMKKGEEFQFYWFGQPQRGLMIVKGGVIRETEATKEFTALQERLLNVYLGPNTVSPELVKSLADTLSTK